MKAGAFLYNPRAHPHIRLATIKGSWSGWPVPLAPRALPRFNATTEQSIPGVSIATFSLGGLSLVLFRLTSHAKFSRSPPKPELSSCRLYTGCRLVSSQITSKLFPQDNGARGFDSVRKVFRCLVDGSLALIFSTRT